MSASDGAPDHTISIFLITGFLGSGKTTFLNRLIEVFPREKRLAVLMNEFGEIGIDGALIPEEGFDLLEINNGSIFCICVKKDFLTGLQKMVTQIRPDVLIMESTGVANPVDLARDLKLPVFRNRLKLEEQFCVIDAACFEDAYEVFASVEKQLESSTVFLLNKVDLATPEQLQNVKALIAKHRPDPEIIETTYCRGLEERILAAVGQSEGAASLGERTASRSGDEGSESEDIDALLSRILEDPERQVTPPDRLVSAVFHWHGSNMEDVRRLMAGIPSGVVRGKGFLDVEGKTLLFDYVMGNASLDDAAVSPNRTELRNRLCFIMPPNILPWFDELLSQSLMLSPEKRTER